MELIISSTISELSIFGVLFLGYYWRLLRVRWDTTTSWNLNPIGVIGVTYPYFPRPFRLFLYLGLGIKVLLVTTVNYPSRSITLYFLFLIWPYLGHWGHISLFYPIQLHFKQVLYVLFPLSIFCINYCKCQLLYALLQLTTFAFIIRNGNFFLFPDELTKWEQYIIS